MILNIWDFDGCLADSRHRYRVKAGRIDLEYWRQNSTPEKVLKDQPIKHNISRLIGQIASGEVVVIATARIWCAASAEWLNTHIPFCDRIHIISRVDENDKRGGAELKIQGIDKWLQGKVPDKVNVFEDNEAYLAALVKRFNATGFYFNSGQGH